MRGKKGGAACGDRVNVRATTSGLGVVEDILPRTSALYRSDAARQKLIASNVTQLVIVVAAVPSFSEEMINRCIAAAEQQQLNVLLVCNKADLIESSRQALATLELYRKLGYPLLQLSAKIDSAPLLPHLEGHLSVLIGQSGMGKSTLVNALIPAAERATADISIALDTGRHTTTHVLCVDKLLAVIFQFHNGIVDVRERLMLALLCQPCKDVWLPAFCQFL